MPIDALKSGRCRARSPRKTRAKLSMKVGQRVSSRSSACRRRDTLGSANPPKFLQVAGQSSRPTHSDQLKPGFAGGNRWK